MAAVDPMAVEVVSTAAGVPTVAEDFTVVVGSTVEAGSVAVDFMAVGFAAGVDSAAEQVSAAAADFAEERAFAEVRSAVDFVVAIAFAMAEAGADGGGVGEVGIGTIGASVLAGAGLMDIGPDMSIRTGMGTTPGGRRPTTVFLLMIPTMILMMILTILTTTRHPHTQIGLTRIDTGIAGTRIRHGRALQ